MRFVERSFLTAAEPESVSAIPILIGEKGSLVIIRAGR